MCEDSTALSPAEGGAAGVADGIVTEDDYVCSVEMDEW